MLKMSAAFIIPLSVALGLASNQAFGQRMGAYGGVNVDAYRALPGDIQFTCTYDIPWDWVHRCPPFAASPDSVSSSRVPGCHAEDVTVATRDGRDRTVTIIRC